MKVYFQIGANDLKDRRRKTPYPGHEDWIKCQYDKGYRQISSDFWYCLIHRVNHVSSYG